MTNKIKGWHFCCENRRLGYGDGREIVVGETLTVDCAPVLCKIGLHASTCVSDALRYAWGPILCRVELGGTIVRGDDKAVATERTTLAMVDATRMLHKYAIWCAERALARITDPDPRSVNALAVKRQWLSGEATDHELRAAWTAARTAARDAGFAAGSAAKAAEAGAAGAAGVAGAAAEVAARSAARHAAWSAVDAAAWAAALVAEEAAAGAAAKRDARLAAWAAEIRAQRAELKRRVNLLMEEAA